MSRKRNTFSTALKHLKTDGIVEAAPTNNTLGVMVPADGDLTRVIDKGTQPDFAGVDWEVNGSDGKDTSGLFDGNGDSLFIGPPGDNSYILGPMSAMFYNYSSYDWTMIGYIREADRRMINLGYIMQNKTTGSEFDGKLSDWDGVNNFTSYGQLTLEQALWFRDTQKKDNGGNDPDGYNYRAFYPGPPSSTPDQYGRYLCCITGTPKASKQIDQTVAPLDQQGSDNFSALAARAQKHGLSKGRTDEMTEEELEKFVELQDALEKDIEKYSNEEQEARKEMRDIAIGFGVDVALTLFGGAIIKGAAKGIAIGAKALRNANRAKNIANAATKANKVSKINKAIKAAKGGKIIRPTNHNITGVKNIKTPPKVKGKFDVNVKDPKGNVIAKRFKGGDGKWYEVPNPYKTKGSGNKMRDLADKLKWEIGERQVSGGQIKNWEKTGEPLKGWRIDRLITDPFGAGSTVSGPTSGAKIITDPITKAFKGASGAVKNLKTKITRTGGGTKVQRINKSTKPPAEYGKKWVKDGKGGWKDANANKGKIKFHKQQDTTSSPYNVNNPNYQPKKRFPVGDSYEPIGNVLSEDKKTRIMKSLKEPVVLPETKQKSYKVSPGKRNKTNFQGMDKLVTDVRSQKPFKRTQDIWSKDWQGYNSRLSQDKKNRVLEKVGDGKLAFNYMLTDSRIKNAEEMEKFWGLHPEMYSYFYNGKKYKALRKEEVKGDYIVFMEDENGLKSNILQSELNLKLSEEHEKQLLDEYNKLLSEQEPVPYLKDPLMKKVAKRLKNEIDYPDKPSAKGYPNEPPPEIDPDTGMHPKYGKPYKYDKLDPVSAVAMRGAPTGNPEVDANVEKAAKKVKPKVKEEYSDWRKDVLY